MWAWWGGICVVVWKPRVIDRGCEVQDHDLGEDLPKNTVAVVCDEVQLFICVP